MPCASLSYRFCIVGLATSVFFRLIDQMTTKCQNLVLQAAFHLEGELMITVSSGNILALASAFFFFLTFYFVLSFYLLVGEKRANEKNLVVFFF